MHRRHLLILTACGETVTGLALLAVPAIPLRLLIGVEQASPETLYVARIAGAALLAIGVGCWLGRSDQVGPAQRGLIAGVLVYSAVVAGLLVYAGLFLNLVGIALWPAVAVHALLFVGCFFSLWKR
ncbi:MAG TPA: hypothetical protein VK395_34485 [Gemmataceae bacterium]|nr:hypothetical protein [Gemmataceae bacterium]